MFRKDCKIKSNVQIKRTEVKHFKELLLKAFKNFTEAILQDVLPKKENVNMAKLLTSSGETVEVYTVQNTPIVFSIKGVILPTVFLLWKYPDMLLTFTTHPFVLNNIYNGADLMMPGVIIPPLGYGSFTEKTPACINISDNKTAIAVGFTAQSSSEFALNGGKGKCVNVIHYYGDKLCSLFGTQNNSVPRLGPPEFLIKKSYEDDFPALGGTPLPKKEANVMESTDTPECSTGTNPTSDNDDEQTDNIPPSENMDDVLMYTLLSVLKYSKSLTLPVLTSNLYKQMKDVCPSDKVLDVKKSSYKKIGQFLQQMCQDGLISVNEVKKGVDAVTNINKEHPKFTEFYIEPSQRPESNKEENKSGPAKNVLEGYIITATVAPLFREFSLAKGDTLQVPDIRKCVTDYVKKHNLQNAEDKRLVNIQGDLATVCKTQGVLKWEELIDKICSSMKSCYTVSSNGRAEINKGKLEPITMTVVTRGGNKKVTCVDNLELYGIPLQEFAKQCQHGIAASTTINTVPHKKSQQLTVQGNQVTFVHKLLKEVYNIPTRYIRGLELAPKKVKN